MYLSSVVNEQIIDEKEYPLADITNLTLPFNVKIACANDHFKVWVIVVFINIFL